MKYHLPVLALILLLFFVSFSSGATSYVSEDELKNGAEKGLSQALDLWREGNYARLYDVSQGGRETREAFARRLAAAPLKPACCWEKMQEVSVRLDGDSVALVRAKLGFEGKGETEYKTRSFRLVRENEGWLVSRSDIFSLAGTGKKSKVRRSSHK